MKIITYTHSLLQSFIFLPKVRMVTSALLTALLLSLLSLTGCSSDNSEYENEEEKEKSNFSMNLKSLPADLINNTQLYVFKGNGDFVKRQWGLTKTGNKITTSMDAGTWELVLLSCNTDISGMVTPPYGGNRVGSPMWETKLIEPAREFLAQTPEELRYAFIPDVNIVADATINKSTTLNRNVSKIQVILEEYTGFSDIDPGKNNLAFVELFNVPTTLGWDGKYLPSRDNPATSTKPIREYFNFVNKNGKLKADTVDFIVPAHLGNDAFSTIHQDTTRHKLSLRASMPLGGNSYFGKTPIEIQFVPKVNRVVQVVLTFRGEPGTELDVKVKVKDWENYVTQNQTFE